MTTILVLSLLCAVPNDADNPPAEAFDDQALDTPHRVDDTEQTARAYLGWRFNLSPGVFLGAGGQASFSIAASIGHGFRVGPTVIVPALAPELFLSTPIGTVFGLLGKAQLIVPIWRFAPFVIAGAGPAFVTTPFATHLAVVGGGGLVFHVASSFAFGVQATYEVILGTPFAALGIAPIIMFAL